MTEVCDYPLSKRFMIQTEKEMKRRNTKNMIISSRQCLTFACLHLIA